MQKFIGIGRLTKDPELTTTTSGISVGKFTLAIPRRFKTADGEREVDFLNCIAWRKNAENIAKYVNKGDQLAVVGTIQTRTYEAQDGTRRYVTEIVVDEFEFIGNKKDEEAKLVPIDDDLGDNLPF